MKNLLKRLLKAFKDIELTECTTPTLSADIGQIKAIFELRKENKQ